MDEFFVELRVWRRRGSGAAVLYRCVRDLTTDLFAVQGADFFGQPPDAARLQASEARFVELFIETSPRERCEWHPSVEAAIAAHDRDFE